MRTDGHRQLVKLSIFEKKKTVIIIKIWLPCNRSACVHRVMKFLGILKNTEDAGGLLQATRKFANF